MVREEDPLPSFLFPTPRIEKKKKKKKKKKEEERKKNSSLDKKNKQRQCAPLKGGWLAGSPRQVTKTASLGLFVIALVVTIAYFRRTFAKVPTTALHELNTTKPLALRRANLRSIHDPSETCVMAFKDVKMPADISPQENMDFFYEPCQKRPPHFAKPWANITVPITCTKGQIPDSEITKLAVRQLALANRSVVRVKLQAALNTLASIKCNKMQLDGTTEIKNTQSRYERYSKRCAGFGMWAGDNTKILKCIFNSLIYMLEVKPYDTILDWGGGCGHQLNFFANLFGTFGVSIDLSIAGTGNNNQTLIIFSNNPSNDDD